MVELSGPSTYYLVATLVDEGLVHRDARGKYALGMGAFELGVTARAVARLTRAARPELDRLAAFTHEVVLLAVLDGDDVVYIDRGQARERFAVEAEVGKRVAAHPTASGKLLIAYAAAQVQDRALRGPLVRRTDRTITSPEALRREFGRIRRRGYSVSWEEGEQGLNSLALPVRDGDGQVVAALNLTAPTSRLTRRSLPQHRRALATSASRVSAGLGFVEVRD